MLLAFALGSSLQIEEIRGFCETLQMQSSKQNPGAVALFEKEVGFFRLQIRSSGFLEKMADICHKCQDFVTQK